MVKAHRATIADVAQLSGLSICTVSRALRNLPNISEKAQQQVAAAAKQLDYKASHAAARLAGGSTKSIAIVAPTATSWFFAQAVEAAEAVFADSGWDTVLISLRNKASVRKRTFGDLDALAQRVDGLLLLNVELKQREITALDESALAVTSVGMSAVPWDNVGIDDEYAAWLATSHLLDLGHRDIAVLTGQELAGRSVLGSQDRLSGFKRAMAQNNNPVNPNLVVAASSTTEGGRAAMLDILANPDRPSAVFAACDESAFGAIMALREHGLAPPHDMSIVGIDDHPMSWSMGLTTVSQPVVDQGTLAATLLCERLSDPPRSGVSGLSSENQPRASHHFLPVELIERTTTRRLQQRTHPHD